jgi:hypothetical protein
MKNMTLLTLPVSIRTIEVFGKKISKSVFNQFERKSILNSDFFEGSIKPMDEVTSVIVARHSFNIDKKHAGENYLHFLWSCDGEMFVDTLNINRSIVGVHKPFDDRFDEVRALILASPKIIVGL